MEAHWSYAGVYIHPCMPRPTKRSALRSLDKTRLRSLVEHFGVDISLRSAVAKLVDALAIGY